MTHWKRKPQLRERCRKLFEELPDDMVTKYQITAESSGEDMSKAIIGLVKKHAGEFVKFDKRRTTW